MSGASGPSKSKYGSVEEKYRAPVEDARPKWIKLKDKVVTFLAPKEERESMLTRDKGTSPGASGARAWTDLTGGGRRE